MIDSSETLDQVYDALTLALAVMQRSGQLDTPAYVDGPSIGDVLRRALTACQRVRRAP